TFSVRPCSSRPLSSAIAFWASLAELISTKPKPRERPVSRSVMTVADVHVPACENSDSRSALVVSKDRFPTKIFLPIGSLLAPGGPPWLLSHAGREPNAVGTDATGSRTNKWTFPPWQMLETIASRRGLSRTERPRRRVRRRTTRPPLRDGAPGWPRSRRGRGRGVRPGAHAGAGLADGGQGRGPVAALDQHVAAPAEVVRHARDPAPERALGDVFREAGEEEASQDGDVEHALVIRDDDVAPAGREAAGAFDDESRAAETKGPDQRHLERPGDVLLRPLAEEAGEALCDVEGEQDQGEDRQEDDRRRPGADPIHDDVALAHGVDAFNEAASASACGGCHPFDRRAGMPGRRKERPVLLSRGSARYDSLP